MLSNISENESGLEIMTVSCCEEVSSLGFLFLQDAMQNKNAIVTKRKFVGVK